MSIYATWLTIEHPDDWIKKLKAEGIRADVIGDDSEDRRLGSPWVYQGSHVLPSESDARGGWVEVAAIPDFITRDGRDDGEGPHDWLRLNVGESIDIRGCVILNRPQVEELRDTLTQWLEAEERA